MAKRVKKSKVVNKTKAEKAGIALRNMNVGVMFTRDFGHASLINLTTLERIRPSPASYEAAKLIAEHRHHWYYKIFVLCRDPQGQERIEFADVDINGNERYFQTELSDALDAAHKAFIKNNTNHYHMVNTGWLALPYRPFSGFEPEPLVDSYCTIYKCWDYLSKYEAEKNEQRQQTLKKE